MSLSAAQARSVPRLTAFDLDQPGIVGIHEICSHIRTWAWAAISLLL